MVLEVIFETKHKIIPQGAVTYAVNCIFTKNRRWK